MTFKSKKLSYYANVNMKVSIGVAQKIRHTLQAAENIGLQAELNTLPNSFKNRVLLIKKLCADDADYYIIRHFYRLTNAMWLVLWWKRFKGAKIIIDVPTPMVAALKEINSSPRICNRLFFKGLNLLQSSWVYWPAHRVIQYADEHWWFNWGVKRKTLLTGNGILLDKKLPQAVLCKENNSLNLLVVARHSDYHGYDRLIRAIAQVRALEPDYLVTLNMVGDGEILEENKALVNELGLAKQVKFSGLLTGVELDKAFVEAHIGVASLGLYRIKLKMAAVLKTREYMSRGLMVIGAGADPDIAPNCPYRLVVKNQEEIDSIVKVLIQLKDMELPNPQEVYDFAREHFSYEKKLKEMLCI